jgi:hypothetical protein
VLARLDPGPFAGARPDLGVLCHFGCLELPCAHTWPLLATINGWGELRAPLSRVPAPRACRDSERRRNARA